MRAVPRTRDLLRFRCTGCGNCCKEPLLPLTDVDVLRITQRTGHDAREIVSFVDRHAIDLDDAPECFVALRQGRRVMVLRHENGGCRYLDEQDRCSIYDARPLGCQIFPFDPTFDVERKLRRLKLIPATDCRYELDGDNQPAALHTLHARYQAATRAYHDKVASWNRVQAQRRRAGQAAQTSPEFLAFLGLLG